MNSTIYATGIKKSFHGQDCSKKAESLQQKISFFNFMAQNFGLVQGVCLLPPGDVLMYVEDVQTSKNNEEIIRKARHKSLRKNNKNIQNEPNFKNNQINLNVCITNSYGNFTIAHLLKTNPKRTQNEPNCQKRQNELKAMYNKGLRSFSPLPPKTKRTQYKPNQTQF